MKQIIPAAFIFLFLSLNISAQNIDSTIEKYGNVFGQERAYFHFDKSTYVAGETIWYKAYLMNGIFPADESKTIYIDFTDDNGKLILHSMAPVFYATAAGQFDIPAEYSAKYIHVKAYTKWMLNFDSAFLYNKDLRILTKTTGSSSQKVTILPTVQFFPEGGDAIVGVNNKIAFKANDQWGKPVKIKGIVQNNHGTFIDSLRPLHDGMGYFLISPRAGDSFIAKWKDDKGTEHTTPLPAIKPEGVSLQVSVSGDKRNFVINSAPSSAGTIHVIGTMYQHEVFKLTKDFSQGSIKGTIPIQALPSGILTITVFDDHWVPLAERITYINNEEYLFTPEMNVEHWGLNRRARNEIQITVPDSLPANFSVAVTDVGIDADSSDNIIAHLLLTGELKGQVYRPAYYFTNTSDSISRALDLVMLTHGWRRFNWAEVVAGTLPKINYTRDTAYLTLSGKLYGALPSQLRDAGDIVLILKQKNGNNKMVTVPVKPNGTFNDPTVVLFDTTHIYYQLSKAKGLSDISVKFMEGRLPPLSHSILANGLFNQITDTTGNYRHFQMADEAAQLINSYKGKVLETVTVKLKTKTPVELLDEKYASGLFSGGDSYQFDVLHDTRAQGSLNIFNYLQGQVAGLQINTTSNPPSLQWRGGSPQLYLDESPAEPDMISSIPVSDVAYIKVMRPPFLGGTNGANGAIAIYTRRGDDTKAAAGKGLDNNVVSGYTSVREFYTPNYNSFDTDNDKKDLRTTLYWNPQVFTTRGNNKVKFTFYNNDVTKSFRVVIEGMAKDGRLAHIESIME
ncbi:MAG: hypothetical protein ABI416_03660 [Ginsengibacter sp.]